MGHRNYSYGRGNEFPSTEQIIERCEREAPDSDYSGKDGCVTFLVVTLLGLASLAGTLLIGIKWA